MCGISGIVWRSGNGAQKNPARAATHAMLSAMRHRGPDGSGVFETENAILGHVRLSIIDIAGGAQPFRAMQDQLALSYNGETYNFNELRAELQERGAGFSTRSDTEVVLQAYAAWGGAFDERLNGMYSYAIFDGRSADPVLWLGTDPVGIKPLFLFQNEDWIIFASELKAVVAAMKILSVDVVPNPQAVRAYLEFGFAPAPLSFLSQVRAFMPGDRCRIDLRTGVVLWMPRRLRPYSRVRKSERGVLDAELREALERAIRRQIVADVPVGFFLSGGIDSSLLLAMAARMGFQTKSFTIRFRGDGHGVDQANEADIATEIARLCGSRHHEIAIDADGLMDSIDDCLAAMDQPLADPACLPLLALSRFASREVKVCLSGDGGDEIFAGYPRHRLERWKRRWQILPLPARRAARHVVNWLPNSPSTGLAEKMRKAKVGFSILDDSNYVLGPFGRRIDPMAFDWNMPETLDGVALMDADIDGQLAGQMLPKTDNMTMAASLECRVPLLDLELVQLASGVPLNEKMNRTTGKLPLRRILADYLPPEIVNRPKRGFRVPLTSWLRGEMAPRVRDELLSGSGIIGQFLHPSEVAKIVEEHMSGRGEHSIRIWTLLALNAWAKRTGT